MDSPKPGCSKDFFSDNPVDLGFVEESESWMLVNRYFPSKIGGRPSWLELKNLPKIEDLSCPKCNEPCVFLCQIYAPIESNPECFHRTIFIFICKNEECFKENSSENLIALRSQLPRVNEFYSPIPPDDDERLPAIPCIDRLCVVCGCRGTLACSRCKSATYCGQSHQRIDWKNGHKLFCEKKSLNMDANLGILFPEYELVMEPEPDMDSSSTCETSEEIEMRRLKEYEAYIKSKNKRELTELSETELAQYASSADDDKQFRKFKKRIEISPEQVLRYNRDGSPLWITNCTGIEKNVSNCENCGNPRIFEFQLMPQMLNYFKDNDKLDWGVIAVYTCKESCDTKSQYVKEFIIKQDIIGENKES